MILITAKWCNENMNSHPMTWKEPKSEFKEVLEAKSLSELKEEIGDFLYSLFCAIHTSTGISLPMVGTKASIEKFNSRLIVWEMIFAKNGLVFDKKYLVNGGNYARPEKVQKALDLARVDQRKY
jgi:uncharacterized protein YabN with tetrapyrrole methylase and pyrophosphatase domain